MAEEGCLNPALNGGLWGYAGVGGKVACCLVGCHTIRVWVRGMSTCTLLRASNSRTSTSAMPARCVSVTVLLGPGKAPPCEAGFSSAAVLAAHGCCCVVILPRPITAGCSRPWSRCARVPIMASETSTPSYLD